MQATKEGTRMYTDTGEQENDREKERRRMRKRWKKKERRVARRSHPPPSRVLYLPRHSSSALCLPRRENGKYSRVVCRDAL